MLPLCFPIKGIRLILLNSCVRWLFVCTWCRPIRKEGYATWDRGNSTWGGRAKGFGTVLVCVSVQEMVYGGGTLLAGNVVKATVSVSQMCNKKNNVLFTDTECLVLSSDFKLPDASQVLLRVPRENNMYNVSLKNIIPSWDLTCLFAKATLDESNLWHRRLGHVNFKTINKLVKGNLVRGLPSKVFTNENSCVACKQGKQHRASYSLLPIPFWAEAVSKIALLRGRIGPLLRLLEPC
nr:ribonuclease H-like domain-containing protein [Tanacetum cinerariifolium]